MDMTVYLKIYIILLLIQMYFFDYKQCSQKVANICLNEKCRCSLFKRLLSIEHHQNSKRDKFHLISASYNTVPSIYYHQYLWHMPVVANPNRLSIFQTNLGFKMVKYSSTMIERCSNFKNILFSHVNVWAHWNLFRHISSDMIGSENK